LPRARLLPELRPRLRGPRPARRLRQPPPRLERAAAGPERLERDGPRPDRRRRLAHAAPRRRALRECRARRGGGAEGAGGLMNRCFRGKGFLSRVQVGKPQILRGERFRKSEGLKSFAGSVSENRKAS